MSKTPTNPALVTLGGQTVGAGVAGAAPAAEVRVRPVKAAVAADRHGFWWGTGRRKTAVARVRLRPAKGAEGKVIFECPRESKRGKDGKLQKATVVQKTLEQYFAELRDRNDATEALKVTNMTGKLDVIVRCSGGGFMGQAGATRLALARALIGYDPTTETILREHNLLTRDSRKVERKKYGQAGARRRFQFSKR